MVSSQAVPTGLTQLSFAGVGRRIGAYFIDMLIFAAVFLAVGFTLKWLRILGFWTPLEGIVETPPEVQRRAFEDPEDWVITIAERVK